MYLLLSFLVLISTCLPAQKADSRPTVAAQIAPNKVLIVYLSRTNNTKAVAEIIQHNVGGKLVAIELAKPYPENYQATVQQVASENETGFLPPLKTTINNMQQYDVVFVGFPTWGMQLPPPVKSFLRQYARNGGPLNGKTIIPFNTNGGYGVGNTFQTVKELCPNNTVLEGFTTRGGSERDGQLLIIDGEKAKEAETSVKAWLKRINVL